MATITLKQILKNEYVQTAIMIIVMVGIVFGFWYGSQLALNTPYPALAVVSGSMLPTLNIGDVIIVQGVPAVQIYANYTTGDIIVFRSQNDPNRLIVHRAVEKDLIGSSYSFTTKGDNNDRPDTNKVLESNLIGKVIARIPYLGNFSLFINALGNFYFFVIIIIVVINILLSLIFDTGEEKKSNEEQPPEEKKLFGKLNIKIVSILIINALVIGFTVFSLFGQFTFHQIGAEPPRDVTIHGMYSDLQYRTSFNEPYNNISRAFLSNGIFTYKIDDFVNGAIRLGVPTFSWAQASVLMLFIFNFWILARHLQWNKKLKARLRL